MKCKIRKGRRKIKWFYDLHFFKIFRGKSIALANRPCILYVRDNIQNTRWLIHRLQRPWPFSIRGCPGHYSSNPNFLLLETFSFHTHVIYYKCIFHKLPINMVNKQFTIKSPVTPWLKMADPKPYTPFFFTLIWLTCSFNKTKRCKIKY